MLYYNSSMLKLKILLPVCIIIFSAIVLLYRLSDLMPFIGDQGWFYLSARNMLVHGNIPLVGIALLRNIFD